LTADGVYLLLEKSSVALKRTSRACGEISFKLLGLFLLDISFSESFSVREVIMSLDFF
jgi:hypothetical protein